MNFIASGVRSTHTGTAQGEALETETTQKLSPERATQMEF